MGIHKCWIAGSDTLVITIDKTTREALGLDEGSFIEIPSIRRVVAPEKDVIKEESKTDNDAEIKQKKIRFK